MSSNKKSLRDIAAEAFQVCHTNEIDRSICDVSLLLLFLSAPFQAIYWCVHYYVFFFPFDFLLRQINRSLLRQMTKPPTFLARAWTETTNWYGIYPVHMELLAFQEVRVWSVERTPSDSTLVSSLSHCSAQSTAEPSQTWPERDVGRRFNSVAVCRWR